MATIVGFQVKPDTLVCPKVQIVVTASTSPPEQAVTWKVDDDDIPTVSNVLTLGGLLGMVPIAEGQTRVVTAKADNSRSVTVGVKMARLDIELDPAPEDVAFGDRYVIDDEPRMPAVTARAIGSGGPLVGAVWQISVKIDPTLVRELCSPRFPTKFSEEFDFSPTGSGSTVVIDFRGEILGGSLNVGVKGTVNGCPVRADTGARIHGTNPRAVQIAAALPNKTLRAIACKESRQRQFDAAADGGIGLCPLFGADGAVGIMQVPDPTQSEIWNWRKNVERGIGLFEDVLAAAAAYPGQVRGSSGFAALVTRFNERRELARFPPLVEVILPDFTTGNLNGDLQQLEHDAIRGYDGWFGTDRFGFPLHEWRVPVDLIGDEEVLRVERIDGLRGEIVWERVPASARPPGSGDPNYVEEVLALFEDQGDGCAGGGHACTALLKTTGPALSFSPPSTTAEETLRAGLSLATAALVTRVRWKVLDADGFGTVTFDTPNELVTVMRAGRPNRARLRLELSVEGDACQPAEFDVSVPQFFRVIFAPEFDADLERLGLRRTAPSGRQLTGEQDETNERVRRAVIETALARARANFSDVNVRFVETDPPVNKAFVTRATIGGLPADLDFGACCADKNAQPTQLGENDHGIAFRPGTGPGVGSPDVGNRVPDQCLQVFSGQVSRWRDKSVFFADVPKQVYLDIFDGLAVRDANGNSLEGKAVDAGEDILDVNAADPEAKRRASQISAAVLLVGRFIGTVLAHECGHVLGLTHTKNDVEEQIFTGAIMDGDHFHTFRSYTGVAGYDPATGIANLVPSVSFDSSSEGVRQHLDELKKVLPILK